METRPQKNLYTNFHSSFTYYSQSRNNPNAYKLMDIYKVAYHIMEYYSAVERKKYKYMLQNE